MKKNIFLIIFSIITNSALAKEPNWILFTNDRKNSITLDINNINKEGQFVKIWVLHDSKPFSYKNSTIISHKGFIEIDCKNKMQRLINDFWYDGPNGTGNIILYPSSTEPSKFDPIVPGLLFDDVAEYACNK